MASIRALNRARDLVGMTFRPQGRDPRTGLDCIGLMILAYRLEPSGIADDYRLSSPARHAEFRREIDRRFRRIARGEPGHLVLMAFGERQHHLAILAERGIIHADARRGCIVESAMPQGVRILGYFRKRRRMLPKGAR